MTEFQEQQIHEFMRAHEEQMYEDLMRLVRIPSVRGEAEPGAPFGRECRRVLEEVQKLFAEHGIDSTIYDEGYLLAYAGNVESEQTCGIFAHADVVPADGSWIMTQPFEPIQKDGFLFGRGISDNKCAIISSLYIAVAIRELGLPFDKKLTIFVGSNEETGMNDVKAYREAHGLPDVGLVPDAAFPCVRGEKCILRIDAFSPVLTEILDADGGNAYNVSLGEVTVRIRGDEKFAKLCEAADDRITVRMDGGDVLLTAKGLSKHASVPDGSVNAMMLTAKVLAECGIEADTMTLTAQLLGDYYGGVCGADAVDSDFGKLTFVNSVVRMKDGRLMLGFDIRFGPETDLNELDLHLQRWFKAHGWEMHRRSGTYGYKLDTDDPRILAMVEEYERFTGTKKAPVFMGGGTYARCLGSHAIPVGHILATAGYDLPAGHGGAHQPDEKLQCEGFLRAAELLCRIVVRIGEI